MSDALSLTGRIILVLALLTLGLVLAQRFFFSFMAQRPADYATTAPPFDMREALSGPILASGVIYGPTGRVATGFTAEMTGTWTATGGTLSESFRYSSGGTQTRAWNLTPPDAEGRFTATADDVAGTGIGNVSGATVTLRYRLRLPENAGGWEVDVTDWLYRGEDGVIVNRAQFRRFGILLGELVGTMRPADQ